MAANEKMARGEREFCRKLRQRGYGAHRAEQYEGHRERENSADVLTSLDVVRFEVKRGYTDTHVWHSQVGDWMTKIDRETPSEHMWCIAWRPDRAGWVFIIESNKVYHLAVGDANVKAALVWGFDAMLNVLDPERRDTVSSPDEWIA